jgi:hypothetical protein
VNTDQNTVTISTIKKLYWIRHYDFSKQTYSNFSQFPFLTIHQFIDTSEEGEDLQDYSSQVPQEKEVDPPDVVLMRPLADQSLERRLPAELLTVVQKIGKDCKPDPSVI